MDNKKKKILIVSRFRRVISSLIVDNKSNHISFLYPIKDKHVLKYEHYSEDINRNSFNETYSLNTGRRINDILKDLLLIRSKRWDAVYFFAPDSDLTFKLTLLSLWFYPVPTFTFDDNYNINKLNLLNVVSKFFRGLIFSKNIKYRYPAVISRKFKLTYNLGMPTTAIIENTNVCDQRCPICETGLRILRRKSGFMGYENFCKVIDKIYMHIEKVSIYFMGEPLLDKDIYRMIRYAKDKGLRTSIATNGNFLDIDKLFWSGLNYIDFKMSGMDSVIHDKYRVGGRFDEVIEHIKMIVQEKKNRGKIYPYVGLGFIVMKHNEHQKEDFLIFAKNLGINNYRLVKTCIRTVDQGNAMLPEDKKYWIYDEEAFNEGRLEPKWKPNNECGPLWHQVVINWEGNVLPCCRDVHGSHSMGNIFETNTFGEIWNNKKYRNFRKLVLKKQKSIKICLLCQEFATYR